MAIIYSVDPRYNADNAFTTWAQQKAFATNLTHTLMLTSKPTHARLIIDYYVSFITCRVFQRKQPNQYYCEVCNWFYTHTSPFRSLNFKIKSKIQMDVKFSPFGDRRCRYTTHPYPMTLPPQYTEQQTELSSIRNKFPLGQMIVSIQWLLLFSATMNSCNEGNIFNQELISLHKSDLDLMSDDSFWSIGHWSWTLIASITTAFSSLWKVFVNL